MTEHDKAVQQFGRRLAGLLVGRQILGFATVWLFVWGTAVLALRAALGTPRAPLVWGLAGLVPCAALAYLAARRRFPSAVALRALLDGQSRSGGLLMAAAEQPLGAWEESLPALQLPSLRWDGRRAAGLLAAAAGFVVLAFALPQRFADLGAGPSLDVNREVDKLAEQIEVLKEEKLLDAMRADDLKQKLEQVREDARGKDPARTLEALDHVEDVNQKTAREAAEEAVRKTEQLARAESFAEALQRLDKSADPKLMAEAMAELAAQARKAAGDKELLDRIDPDLAKALEKGAFTKEELKRLAEAMSECKGGKAGRLAKLHKARLISAEALKQCDKAGECKGEALAAYLKECKGGT
jgi:hypothetical protein